MRICHLMLTAAMAVSFSMAASPLASARKAPRIVKTQLVGRLGEWKDSAMVFKGAPQGFAVHGKNAVLVRDRGQVNILDLKQKKVVAVYSTALKKAHCNNAGFGPAKYSRDSFLPLLYVTECYGDRRCFVLDIDRDSARVVQEIYYQDPAQKGPMDWCIDPRGGFIYAYGGPPSGRYLKKFPIPDPKVPEVRYTPDDVLEVVTFTDVRIPQGSMVRKGYAFIPDGCPPYPTIMHVVDMGTGEKVLMEELKDLDAEPEGIDMKGKWIYMAFFSKSKDINTNIYRLKIR
ncbi:MAG: hypothetical protein IJM35_05515 [Bacteroidales bacterium]|nr:hypothetical protein [Bacteroidales bacterium]